MDRILQNIGEMPLFQLLTDIVKEGPGLLMKGLTAMGKGIADGATAVGNAMSDAVPALGNFLQGPSQSEGLAIASPSPQIETPTQSMGAQHVDMAELGQFSPQSFSGMGLETGGRVV